MKIMEKKTVETTKTVDSYKKPQMVAKADAKKSFVAGCGTENSQGYCGINYSCEVQGVS